VVAHPTIAQTTMQNNNEKINFFIKTPFFLKKNGKINNPLNYTIFSKKTLLLLAFIRLFLVFLRWYNLKGDLNSPLQKRQNFTFSIFIITHYA
jgi:hypothetical protein